MIAYLTSSPGCYYIEDGKRIAASLSRENGFLDALKKDWKEQAKCLIISAEPENMNKNDGMKELFAKSFFMSDLAFKEFAICDCRNVEEVNQLDAYDVVILSGGHVPTQNAFFRAVGLKEKIAAFDGILIGISAGTMNCAKEVYAQPELEGESLDADYKRFIEGLGITDVQILPHYQEIKDHILDGKRVMEDITYPDSMGRKFYALVDGSYLLIKNGKSTLYGEGYVIENGAIRQICENGKHLEIR